MIEDQIGEYFKEGYGGLVKRIARRCPNPQDAEDIVMEGFARALKYKDSYRSEKQEIGVWIFIIVLNAYRDFISDLFKQGMTTSVSDHNIEGYETDFERCLLVEQVLSGLDRAEVGSDDEVLWMYYRLGMTPAEIAECTPHKSKHVRNCVHRFGLRMRELCCAD